MARRDPGGARGAAPQARRRDRRAHRRARRDRIAERGQTVGGRAGRDAGLLRQHPLLRRRRPHPRGPLRRRVHAGLHVDDPPRADRDRRPGRAVELPVDDGGLEVRTRARRRQRLDPQALGADAALDAPLRGARGRRDPAGRPERDHGRRRAGRSRHRPPSGRPHGLAHRRRRDGQGGREGRVRDAEARPPRARRQGAGRRVRRRGSRPGRRGDQGRRLLELRAGLHGRLTRDGRPEVSTTSCSRSSFPPSSP